ncbi:MAG: cation diffusion facilitator family transporter [bacterium]
MDRITSWIVKKCIPDWENIKNPRVRSRHGLLEGWVSIAVNLVLAVVKLVLGLAVSSAGLVADAVHSLSDMASSVVVIFSFKVSSKPPDIEHPFGHAKAEYIGTLVVALMMVMAGVQIGQQSVTALWGGSPAVEGPPFTLAVFVILMGLMVAKEALGGFSRALGKMIDSETLKADAWHHRTDALSTGIVILGLWGRNWGIYWMDGAAGFLVALWIVYTGLKLAYDAISPLLGEAVPPGEIDAIRAIANGVPGVESSHDIKVHKYGHFYFTTIHMELSDRLDVHKMHEIAVIMETRILKRFPGECVVHMDPVNLFHPLLHQVSDVIKEMVLGRPELVEFRDLKLWREDGREKGDVEICVTPHLPEGEYDQVSSFVRSQIAQRFPALEMTVRMKVDFTSEGLRA